jgi:hypothetical protein
VRKVNALQAKQLAERESGADSEEKREPASDIDTVVVELFACHPLTEVDTCPSISRRQLRADPESC